MTYRLRNLGIAVALALVAGLLTVFYVTNYKRDVRDAESNVTVYVAGKDIPAGTPGAVLTGDGFLVAQDVVKRNVTPGAISDPGQVADRVTAEPIYAGEQVTTRRFTTENAKGVRAELTGNKRAFQVAGDGNQVLAGTLVEGDRVDVVGSWNVPEQKTNHFSRVVLRDLLVLKVSGGGVQTEKLAAPDAAANWVILAVTDAQAQKLFWIMRNGEWSLQLRPAADAADSPESAESAASMLLDGFNANQLRAVENAARILSDEGSGQ